MKLNSKTALWLVLGAALLLSCQTGRAQNIEDFEDEYADAPRVADPLEPLNRGIYHVNDKIYFWVLKPLATGYEWIVPTQVRLGIRNMFDNVAMPKRCVNCLLQGRLKDSGSELARFGINTTVGVLGWRDAAADKWGMEAQREDTGQTFGRWGLGSGLHLTLPFFGPSNARDSIGLVGDIFLDPIHYAPQFWVRYGLNAEKQINNASLALGEYEKSKEASLDHYVSLRDMYEQYREQQIRE
jgi:phospholipid-binding lipoprotein MlaA